MDRIQLIFPAKEPGREPKCWSFSASQFGFFLTLVLTLSFWGLASTLLMVYQVYNPSVVEKIVEKTVLQRVPEQVIVEKYVPIEAIEVSSVPVDRVMTNANDAVYVRNDKIDFSNGRVSYRGTIINRTKELVAGSIWIIGEFLLEDGKSLVLNSAPAAEIMEDGMAAKPEKATAFSTRNEVEKTIALSEIVPPKAKLVRLAVNLYDFESKKLIRKFVKPAK